MRQLPGTSTSALPALLHEQKVALNRTLAEVMDEWRHFEAESGLGMGSVEQGGGASTASPLAARSSEAEEAAAAEGATPFAVQLRSLERRVATMGGVPALGACVLPRSTPGVRTQLHATASPAALEMLRSRMSGSEAEATPLRKIGSGGEEVQHTPLVQLRHVAGGPAGSGSKATPGQADPSSELAAALQRRAQRSAAQELAAVVGGVSS